MCMCSVWFVYLLKYSNDSAIAMKGCLWSTALLKFLVSNVRNFCLPSLPVQQDTEQCKACGLG